MATVHPTAQVAPGAALGEGAEVGPYCVLGPGAVLPASVHGGPGRAGGGEELGALRGLLPYQQRVALQGDRAVVERIARPAAPATSEAAKAS